MTGEPVDVGRLLAESEPAEGAGLGTAGFGRQWGRYLTDAEVEALEAWFAERCEDGRARR